MQLIDNINQTLRDDLVATIKSGSRVSIAAASFSIYAFQELKEQLKDIDELRFIFTSPSFTTEKADKQRREFYIPRLNRERDLFGSEFEIKLRNELLLKAVAKECAEWIRQKACFKSNRTNENMMGFINVDDVNYMPITGFTTVDLGCERGNNAYQFVQRTDAPMSQFYLNLFNQVWHDGEKLQVVTEQVLDNITNAYKENAPEFIYFVTLYNIFNEFLEDISEDVLPNEATGFKSSVIWNKLYNFQRDAALAIINKLEKYNGCILADSVGLGKTFTALSVIKYYENRNKSVLVLCPKKLHQNWVTYRSNYLNNPLVADRLRYDILYHTDLSRQSGQSNGLDLEHINWGNYDLVVIDESHNFRNGGKVTTDENDENPRENRYLQLMNKVIRAGVKTKVLMLSATPVNNRFNDLRNQLQLAYEGDSERMDALLNTTSSIDKIFRDAQSAFNRWSKMPPEERTTKNLLSLLSFDFFEVLDSVTIARSRKHIEQYYDTTDIGKFPERLKPISRSPKLTDLPTAVSFNDIFVSVTELNLAIYTPSDFILPSKLEKYLDTKTDGSLGNLSRSGRERGIRQLMSINLLKRLESSVNSFRLTLTRIKDFIQTTVDAIDRLAANGGHSTVNDYDFDSNLDFDEREDSVFIGGKKTKIDLADMDYVQWREYLVKDLDNLRTLLFMLEDITPEHDSKLQLLIDDIRSKFANPINPGNKKIIIFTAFSDTAQYLYENIASLIKERTGLNTALISGDVEARCTIKTREKMDFNKVLTLFSPISKEKAAVYPKLNEEIDVLIATDCISEGQNLQDCDYLINYDIHWNPVRIIQRFGRIDRIGSRNAVIQLVNYWPDMDLDEYIDLKGRVEARMKVSVLTATGDDNPLTDAEQGDLKYRRDQLDRLKEEVVDIEEMNTGVSIMDLGLNEFRLDLLEYIKQDNDIEHTPMGLHAIVPADKDTPPGVIFVLKNRNNSINIDRKNRLHPFYMVYITKESEVVIDHLDPKSLLDTMRHLCRGNATPLLDLCHKFNAETRDGQRMGTYSKLLGDAISSLIKVKETTDLFSFLDGDSGSLFGNEVRGLDDFELICFLIIRKK
ncbi:helicase-related protein [uncultured Duncaniella sp.]|uniref:helicase-related protein n=1 Tax=uncultured Duncaniella sp. TaxID=2768039 RepID=UPI002627E783|nr:helicase-related protein [uncultured Duncaniella sp.]